MASAPLAIFELTSTPTESAPTIDASRRMLPVPANGSRRVSPSFTPAIFTRALESFGKIAEGWKKARDLGLRPAHPWFMIPGLESKR